MSAEPQRALSLVVREALAANPRAWALLMLGVVVLGAVVLLVLWRDSLL